MIIKDYFADGLLQIAIVLSLLRSDLDSFLDISIRPLPVRSHLFETNDGPLSSITRIDLNFHSREFVREYPKVLDNYTGRFSPLLRDIHSLSDYRRFDGISTNVHAWLVNEGGSDGYTSSCECSSGDDADDTNTSSQNASSLPGAAETSVIVSEPNPMNPFFEDELSKEVDYMLCLSVVTVICVIELLVLYKNESETLGKLCALYKFCKSTVLVSWSLTFLFSTDMAISETKAWC